MKVILSVPDEVYSRNPVVRNKFDIYVFINNIEPLAWYTFIWICSHMGRVNTLINIKQTKNKQNNKAKTKTKTRKNITFQIKTNQEYSRII